MRVYKAISLVLLISFILIGCGGTHHIARSGYEIGAYTKQGCSVVFGRELKPNLNSVQKGSISLTDKGSSKCSPQDAFDILRNEACELDANLIVISNERMPDIGSSCYRCDAAFYKADSSAITNSYKADELISPEASEKMTNQSNASKTFLYIGGFAVGFAGGWLIMQALKKK